MLRNSYYLRSTLNRLYSIFLLSLLLIPALLTSLTSSKLYAQESYNTSPPSQTVRLVFIHHSTGEDWLNIGGLREILNRNNYYVVEASYGWGPIDKDVNDGKTIGDHTDIGHWYNWFLGPHRDEYLEALYTTDYTTSENSIPDPGGENEIVMFKSCFSTAQIIWGNPNDPPLPEGQENPLWGKGCDEVNEELCVSNVKGLYRDLLKYFQTRLDKMFILITTPPSMDWGYPGPEFAANQRAISNWLVYDWLDDYPYNNVFVFDYYNVLTSNGGDYETSDVNQETGNHHRFWNGEIQHVIGYNNNYTAYPSENGGDNHPNEIGHRKAAVEFIDLLNIAYHCWKGDGKCPEKMGRSPESPFPPISATTSLTTSETTLSTEETSSSTEVASETTTSSVLETTPTSSSTQPLTTETTTSEVPPPPSEDMISKIIPWAIAGISVIIATFVILKLKRSPPRRREEELPPPPPPP